MTTIFYPLLIILSFIISFCSTFILAYDDGLPNLYINQSVHAITGDYLGSKENEKLIEFDQHKRVKLQRAYVGNDQTPIILSRFIYHENSAGEGYTVVFDALDNKTIYRYSNEKYLTAIESYLNHSLYCKDCFYWDQSSAEPKLLSRALKNDQDQTYYCKTFEYNQEGLLIKQTIWGNLSGLQTSPFILDKNGRPTSPDTEHYSTTYQYKDKLLLREHDDNEKFISYSYHPKTFLLASKFIGERNQIALRSFYLYDTDQNLIKTINDDGCALDPLDLQGVTERRISVIQPSAHPKSKGKPLIIEDKYLDISSKQEVTFKTTLNTYSENGLLIKEEVQDHIKFAGQNHLMEYNQDGLLTTIEDAQGNSKRLKYDTRGNLIQEVDLNNSNSCSQTYDFADRVIIIEEKTDDKNLKKGFRYDILSRPIVSIDTCSNETNYHYDSLGRVVEVVFPEILDANDQAYSPYITKEYDICNRVIAFTDATGTTKTKYNIRDNPTEIIYPDGTKESFEYYLNGNLYKKTEKNGISTHYQYDFLGRVTSSVTYSTSMNPLKHIQQVYNAYHLISSTNELGFSTLYTYDSAGKQIAIVKETSEGNQRLEFDYSHSDGIIEAKEWYGHHSTDYSVTSTTFNKDLSTTEILIKDSAYNILKQITSKPEANDQHPTNHIQCVNNRNQHVWQQIETDINGTITTTTFDALGHIEKITKANSAGQILLHKEFRHDANGTKLKEIDTLQHSAKKIVTSWEYGPNSRLEKVIEAKGTPKQKTISYSYNALGQLEITHKPDGIYLIHEYNESGQLQHFYSSDQSIDYHYSYDLAGNIISLEDLAQKTRTSRLFNSSNLILEETLGNNLSVSNAYDIKGRRTQFTLPDGSGVKYTYNALYLTDIHRLSTNGKELYAFSYLKYDLKGKCLSAQLIDSLGIIDYSYDHQDRLTRIATPYWSETITGYDQTGNIIGLDITTAAQARTSQYSYDFLNRLIDEQGNQTHHYEYDSSFNCIQKDQKECTINELSQLQSDGKNEYRYDLNGNLIESRSPTDITIYHYDALNRLTQAIQKNNYHVTYTYDAFNRRLSKQLKLWDTRTKQWSNPTEWKYLYDGENEIGSIDQAGTLIEFRVLGQGLGAEIGAAVAIEIKGHLFSPIHDHRGSVCCLIDTKTKSAVEFYNYSAFGEEQIDDEEGKISPELAINPWRFSSKRLDLETGFIYFGKRNYDPSTGRWITQDPFGFIEGINRYIYTSNNPLNRNDLYGLFSFSNFFQNIISSTVDLIKSVTNSAIQLFSTIKEKMTTLSSLTEELESLGQLILYDYVLLLTGAHEDKTESGKIGKGEVHDKVRITHTNGILNYKHHILESAEMISSLHGGVNIHYTYRTTSGWTKDFVNCFLLKIGYISTEAQQLANSWKAMIEEMGGVNGGGKLIHFAHSIGGTETNAAKTLLSPEELKMITVYTLGSATMIPNEGFNSVTNYVSRRDIIPLLDLVGYIQGILDPNSNLVFVGSHSEGLPFIDHWLGGDSYRNVFKELGQKFIDTYGSLP